MIILVNNYSKNIDIHSTNYPKLLQWAQRISQETNQQLLVVKALDVYHYQRKQKKLLWLMDDAHIQDSLTIVLSGSDYNINGQSDEEIETFNMNIEILNRVKTQQKIELIGICYGGQILYRWLTNERPQTQELSNQLITIESTFGKKCITVKSYHTRYFDNNETINKQMDVLYRLKKGYNCESNQHVQAFKYKNFIGYFFV